MNDLQTIYVFEFPSSKENNFWIAYNYHRKEKIACSKLISTFLQDYADAKKKEIDPKSVHLFALLERFNSNYVIIQNLNTEINFLKNSDFCISFAPLPEEPIYAKHEIINKLMENGSYFFKQKKYYSAVHFFQHVEMYGLVEISKICYIIQQMEYLKKIIDTTINISPNDYELIKFAGDFFEKNGEIGKSLQIYKKFRSKFPIFNVIFHRISLSHEKQQYVEDVVKDALLDPKIHDDNITLLFECSKLFIKNNQLQEACKLCLLNHDFLLKCIEYFTSVPNLPKVYRKFVCESNISPIASSIIARKLFKYCEVKHSLKIAESLFQNNRYNFFCALTYMDLLLRSYDYERLVDVIMLFLTILPKKMGKFDIEKIADSLQNSSTFRKKTFNPYYSPDFLYCDYDFEKEDEINLRLNNKVHGNSRIKQIDINKVVQELCHEENVKCFEIIIMIIASFFFIIGDIATFKNFISCYSTLIDFDSNTIPFMFYDIQQMYQSAVLIKNSAFPLMSNSFNMLAIGDVHSTSCCNTKVFIQKQGYYITSLPILNLSIHDLRMDSKNYRKELFFRFVRKAEQFQKLMIVLGTKDCERIIPKLAQKMVFSANPILAAIRHVVDIYEGVLEDIESSLPSVSIIIHCAFPRFNWSIAIVDRFNSEVSKRVKGKYPFVSLFSARSNDNYFNIPGFSDSLPDSKYPINLNATLSKVAFK